jgi:hypothetical protein
VRDRTREEIRSQLGDEGFAAAWREGQQLETEQAAELALEAAMALPSS